MKFWQKLIQLLEPFKRTMVFITLGSLLVEIFNFLSPYFFKKVIDEITHFSAERIVIILIFVVAVFAADNLTALSYFIVNKRVIKFLLEVERYLPTKAQEKLVFLSLGYHERQKTGSTITKVQRGVDRLSHFLGSMFWDFLPTFFKTVLTFGILLYFSWPVALVFTVSIPFFVILTLKMNRQVAPLRLARHRDYERAYGRMTESVVNINTVQSFSQEQREVREHKSIRDYIFGTELKEFIIRFRSDLSRGVLLNAGRVLVLLLSVYQAYQSMISLGALVFFITLSEKAYSSLFNISRIYDQMAESTTAIDRLLNLLGQKSEIQSKEGAWPAGQLKGAIEFQKISFHYSDNSVAALNSISFKVKAGETVALVGPSGGGKSTIVKLLYRHYDPMSGQILVDGRDIRDYDLKTYRANLAIVPQEVEIFDTSVAENIAYGQPQASFEEIERAAKIANAHRFIERLKNGYETAVGERGIKLSGGQKQRIGIARAILCEPRILIFDEATSHLDSLSEKLIQESLQQIGQDRTIIIIAHRLSTISQADKILVIEKGRVVEAGNHQKLCRLDGLYKKLLELQRQKVLVK